MWANIYEMAIGNLIFALFMLRLYEVFKWVDRNYFFPQQNQSLNKIQNYLVLFIGIVSLFLGIERLIRVLNNLDLLEIQNITFDQTDLVWILITGLFYLLGEIVFSWLTFKKNFKEENSDKISLFFFLKNKIISILFNFHSVVGILLLMLLLVYFKGML